MKILIIHAHGNNRGDEAAIKAMTDEILKLLPDAKITISKQAITDYPCMNNQIRQIGKFPEGTRMGQLSFFLSMISKGRFAITREGKEFLHILKEADLVLHAPGGPSIGDIYDGEWQYLWRLNLVRRMKKPYMFYAPSMGPFENGRHEKLRKRVLLGAEKIIVRDPVSIRYVKSFMPRLEVEHAMDSALQHDLGESRLVEDYQNYTELNQFVNKYKRIVGVTITDLKWHPVYGKTDISFKIEKSFSEFIGKRVDEGYGILFIPQLYGEDNDYDLMKKYMKKNGTFIIDSDKDKYDSYFQQYIIGKLYAVVGMRYHSNIFSAKMGTPFVSISYEQKMEGFMESVNLEDYCLPVEELSGKSLERKFKKLVQSWESYRIKLEELHEPMRERAYYSTKAVKEILENLK